MSAKLAAEEAYTVAEAAALKRVSMDFIYAAIKRTDPPVLAAKNVSTGKRPTYRIRASALEEWFDQLEDA